MVAVADRYLERAYLRSQVVVAEKVRAGQVGSLRELVATTTAVLVVTAMSLRNKSYRAAASAGQRPSVTSLDLDRLPASAGGPGEREELREAGRGLRAAVRAMGRPAFQAYRRRAAFVAERGTRHGVVPHLARLAVGGGGEVVRFQKAVANAGTKPTAAVTRAVRRLVRRADECLARWAAAE